MKNSLTSRIEHANEYRDPHFLQMKYKGIYDDKYRFFRATAHLFYEDIPAGSFLYKAPSVWLCGDLHLENFGSYKGDNRVAYFNINDFDEAILGSPLLDIARMLCSIHIAAGNLHISDKTANTLADIFINTYFEKIAQGYIRVLEKETTTGVIKKFLKEVESRKRKAFIKRKTVSDDHKLSLLIDDVHTAKAEKEEKKNVAAAVKEWALQTSNPSFFNVEDVALRIAGTASLGLKRYEVLIQGKGDLYTNYLLDLKESRPSCLSSFVKVAQPAWASESERIIEIEKRFISDPPALLHSINIAGKNFVMKELQPLADRIDYRLFSDNDKKLELIVNNMACIYAWSNLRASGRQGSASVDELIAFAKNSDTLKTGLKEYALLYTTKMNTYYNEYCEAYKNGEFNIT